MREDSVAAPALWRELRQQPTADVRALESTSPGHPVAEPPTARWMTNVMPGSPGHRPLWISVAVGFDAARDHRRSAGALRYLAVLVGSADRVCSCRYPGPRWRGPRAEVRAYRAVLLLFSRREGVMRRIRIPVG